MLFLSSSSSDRNSFYPVPKLFSQWVAAVNWWIFLPPDKEKREEKKEDQKKRKRKRSHSMHLQNRNLINMLPGSSWLFLHIAESNSLRQHILIRISVILSRKFLWLFLHSLNLVLFIISKSVILPRKFLWLFLFYFFTQFEPSLLHHQ